MNMTRRDLLKASGAVTAATALAAAAPVLADEAAEPAVDWRTPPEPVSEFAAEYTYDAVVVGCGYAGVCACRELAEEGFAVALVEAQPEDDFSVIGNESSALNSKLLDRAGVPHVDPVEYYQNWMAATQNYPNADLVMKFCVNMGEANDWYYGVLTEDELATMVPNGWPGTANRLAQVGPFKFWPGTAQFETEGVKQTQIVERNRDEAVKCGAQTYFGTEALYLVTEDGAVKGLVAQGPDGAVKFNCRAVVVATGGFANNHQMLADLCPDYIGNFVEGEEVQGTTHSDGRGIQMALWAGARLETISMPTMNGKHVDVPTNRVNVPQAVWLGADGKRFCNEYYPIIEHRGTPPLYRERQTYYAIADSDILTYVEYNVPQHGTFNPTEANLENLAQQLEIARAKYQGTYEEPEQAPRAYVAISCCDDTLEGLAAQLGLEGEVAQNFLDSIERYNGYCETGADLEYGRYAETLFPVKNPPFYAIVGTPGMGKIMTTVGGVITDGDQNALDKDFKPIPGLYVSGNDCGRRFGTEYITPTPGVSLGMAITLGRECGRSVGAFLNA